MRHGIGELPAEPIVQYQTLLLLIALKGLGLGAGWQDLGGYWLLSGRQGQGAVPMEVEMIDHDQGRGQAYPHPFQVFRSLTLWPGQRDGHRGGQRAFPARLQGRYGGQFGETVILPHGAGYPHALAGLECVSITEHKERLRGGGIGIGIGGHLLQEEAPEAAFLAGIKGHDAFHGDLVAGLWRSGATALDQADGFRWLAAVAGQSRQRQ